MMRTLLLVALCGAPACGARFTCESPATVLAGQGEGALTCDDVDHAVAYVEILAGRDLVETDRRRLARGLVRRWRGDAATTRAGLDGVRDDEARLMGLTGLAAAEARSSEVYVVLTSQEFIGATDDDVQAVALGAIASWAHHDTDRLALTEVDIEGWIYYASLCREAQGAGPMRLSVADRVAVYADVVARYEGLDREGRIALSAVGPFWPNVRDAWTASDWDVQHAWIGAAPLPPPMTATAKGYFGALVEGDVVGHARVLHETLGPFHLAVFR